MVILCVPYEFNPFISSQITPVVNIYTPVLLPFDRSLQLCGQSCRPSITSGVPDFFVLLSL